MVAVVQIFVEHWGGIICNFTPILPYSQHWGGMNLNQDFFQVNKLSEDQKKRRRSSQEMEHFFSPSSGEDQKKKTKVFTRNGILFSPNSGEDQKKTSSQIRNGTLFSPNSSTDLRSNAHQSQIIGGDSGEEHTQIVEGIQTNYWGNMSPHPPPRFRQPWLVANNFAKKLRKHLRRKMFEGNYSIFHHCL